MLLLLLPPPIELPPIIDIGLVIWLGGLLPDPPDPLDALPLLLDELPLPPIVPLLGDPDPDPELVPELEPPLPVILLPELDGDILPLPVELEEEDPEPLLPAVIPC